MLWKGGGRLEDVVGRGGFDEVVIVEMDSEIQGKRMNLEGKGMAISDIICD